MRGALSRGVEGSGVEDHVPWIRHGLNGCGGAHISLGRGLVECEIGLKYVFEIHQDLKFSERYVYAPLTLASGF